MFMGWQLFPTGIGWKSFGRTTETGTFVCPGCRHSATYQQRTERTWITVLFLPIVPLQRGREHVRCTSCKVLLPMSAVTATPSSLATGQRPAQPVDVVAELERLEGLRDRGTISDSDFVAAKRLIMGAEPSSPNPKNDDTDSP